MDRLAKSLEVLRAQVNQQWPKRSKLADGWIGDAAHAARSSDHNPWIEDGADRVVSAIDLTHDPANNFDSYRFADMLLANKDPRIKYIISNRRIASGTDQSQPAWKWRPYNGANAHDKHVHISVKSAKTFYDNQKEWQITALKPTVQKPKVVHPVISLGMTSKDVPYVHTVLGMKPYEYFGNSSMRAVQALQEAAGLTPTGIVDGPTWALLEAKKPWV